MKQLNMLSFQYIDYLNFNAIPSQKNKSIDDCGLDSRADNIRQIEGYFESKGSKFFSSLVLFGDFSKQLNALKSKHPKARHIVFAARYVNELGQICEKSSDDGEPKGSSGIPTLNVLKGERLINCAMFIVRYFGGTLLGVGGLARAYSAGAKNAIKEARERGVIVPFVKTKQVSLKCLCSEIDALTHKASKCNVSIVSMEFLGREARLTLEGAEESLKQIMDLT